MPRGKNKQGRLFDDKLDSPIVKAADEVIELRKEMEELEESSGKAEQALMELMKKTNRSRIHHGGYTIEITMTDPKEKLKLKETKETKVVEQE